MRAATPPILSQLQSSESVSGQVSSLRALKNELIGHDQRKEAYVTGGIFPILAQVLALRRPGKAAAADSNRSPSSQATSHQGLGETQASDETACLQAILIAGSLAQGTFIPNRGSTYH